MFINCVPRPDGPPCINDCVIVAPHETHILGERRAFIGGGRVPAGEDERLPEDRALQRLDQQQTQSMRVWQKYQIESSKYQIYISS